MMYNRNYQYWYPAVNTPYSQGTAHYYPYYPPFVNYNYIQRSPYHRSPYPNSVKEKQTKPLLKRIIGYYPAWASYSDFKVTDVDVTKLTHINYAFANLQAGKIVLGYPDIDEKNFEQLT